MINTRHLASLMAIAERGSFSAAGQAIGRSHSAISLHIKALEAELSTTLIDRAARPVALTAEGADLVRHARRLGRVLEDIAAIGQSDRLAGRLSVGVVPTAMAHLAPPALAHLKAHHPNLGIDLHTGLSGELARAVQAGDVDVALVTAPETAPPDLTLRPVADQPLVVIAPNSAPGKTDKDLIESHPFIWFSRKTWAGQQIERRLSDRNIQVRASMETDSLEAIEALVQHGLGVSIVPLAGDLARGLKAVPFDRPQMIRRLVLLTQPRAAKTRFIDALHRALTAPGSGNSSTP